MGKYKFDYPNTQTQNTQTNGGYSLLELIMTVSIIAVLASVAVPSFANVISNRHITAASMQLSSILLLSRNHALNTGTTVIVCHANDSSMTQCSESRNRNTLWSNGVISFADIDGDNSLSDKDTILSTTKSHPSVALVFNQNGRLRFFYNGSARSAGFYVCSALSEEERHIRILHTGRSRTSSKMGKNQRKTCLSKVA